MCMRIHVYVDILLPGRSMLNAARCASPRLPLKAAWGIGEASKQRGEERRVMGERAGMEVGDGMADIKDGMGADIKDGVDDIKDGMGDIKHRRERRGGEGEGKQEMVERRGK